MLQFLRKQALYMVCVLDVQAPLIDNPEYEHIPDVYKLPPLKFVGFELWQARPPTYSLVNTFHWGCLQACHVLEHRYAAGTFECTCNKGEQ